MFFENINFGNLLVKFAVKIPPVLFFYLSLKRFFRIIIIIIINGNVLTAIELTKI